MTRASRGFSLVEVILVLGLMAALGMLFAPALAGASARADTQLARSTVALAIDAVATQYSVDPSLAPACPLAGQPGGDSGVGLITSDRRFADPCTLNDRYSQVTFTGPTTPAPDATTASVGVRDTGSGWLVAVATARTQATDVPVQWCDGASVTLPGAVETVVTYPATAGCTATATIAATAQCAQGTGSTWARPCEAPES